MDSLELVRLSELMALTSGSPEVVIGLIDGPVNIDHEAFRNGNVRMLNGEAISGCAGSSACQHGTFIAGILSARRGSEAPSIAPDCTLLVRPVFSDAAPAGRLSSASTREIAEAIVECVNAGVRIINLSAALFGGSLIPDRDLGEALNFTAQRGVLVFAAAGNQGAVSGSTILSHPWIVPVVACDPIGQPLGQSNLGRSIGVGGFGAPGHNVASLAPWGATAVLSGTSVATPFVAGAAALLWSLFPRAAPLEIKRALRSSVAGRRKSIAPPLLNAWAAYEVLAGDRPKGVAS